MLKLKNDWDILSSLFFQVPLKPQKTYFLNGAFLENSEEINPPPKIENCLPLEQSSKADANEKCKYMVNVYVFFQ